MAEKTTTNKWIRFEIYQQKPKTTVWNVIANEGNIELGRIGYYPSWRKYVFIPKANTIFEQDCLRDIADFTEEQTKQQRKQARERREEKDRAQV